ncbi:MAG: AAA family ATPase [Alphaproteobacteria bacterium]|nr:AAA family ATPase [Alphaproteobacteria bacterium]OJV47093.1 MAG: hypothetical protein BGO28_01440 [Alphaproteobacteria bacterium 43-37]
MIKKTTRIAVSVLAMALSEGAYANDKQGAQDSPYYDQRYEFLSAQSLYASPQSLSSIDEAKDFLRNQRFNGAILKLGADTAELCAFFMVVAGVTFQLPANQAFGQAFSFFVAQSAWTMELPNKLSKNIRLVASGIGTGICKVGGSILPEASCKPFVEEDLLSDYEVLLAWQWHKLPPVLREKLANHLFLVRRGQKEDSNGVKQMFNVLKMPQNLTSLVYNPKTLEDSLVGLNPDLIEDLKDIAFRHVIQSQNTDPTIGRKVSLYFYGKPGTGKTQAANALARAIGGKSCTINLSGKKVEDLLGSSTNIGLLAQCLIDTAVLNPVIILDDADWELNTPGSPMLGFVLSLNDPEMRSVKDQFLENQIDIGNMMFIYSGNSRIMKKDSPVEAFEQRVHTLKFEGFDDNYRKKYLKDTFVPTLMKQYPSNGIVTLETMQSLVDEYFANWNTTTSVPESAQDMGMRVVIEDTKRVYFKQLRKAQEMLAKVPHHAEHKSSSQDSQPKGEL